jgi:hypothetical protein
VRGIETLLVHRGDWEHVLACQRRRRRWSSAR